MSSILFLPLVLLIVHAQENFKIPNAAELPVFPGSIGTIDNSDQGNGPPGGFGSLGLVPLTNIGSGAVGNIGPDNNGQGGNGNLPVGGPPNNGQGGLGGLLVTGPLNNGQAGLANLPITGPLSNGQAGLANLAVTGPLLNNGQGELRNLSVNGPINNGQGGPGNFPGAGPPINSQGGLGNFPVAGPPINDPGGLGNFPGAGPPINGQGGLGNVPVAGPPINGQGGLGNVPVAGPPINGQGGLENVPVTGLLSGTLGQLTNVVPDLVPGLGAVLGLNGGTGIERPCQVFDIYCIRRYFKKNGKCKEVRGPVPEPYFRAQSSLQISRINATFSAFNVLYEGLNGRINEFYINRRTDKLVISIEFRNVTFFSKDVYYRFYRRNREPITTYDYLYLNYKSFITTTIIPKIRDLQLYKSETTTFANDAIPAFSIGPNAFSYPDPTVQFARAELLRNIPVVVQEALLTEGPFTAATFIQNSICDFKLQVL